MNTLLRGHARVRKRWTAVLLVLTLAAAIVAAPAVMGVQVASATPNCTSDPTPQTPAEPTEALFDPDSAAPPADPSDTSDYAKYGWAGLSWSTFDLGCMGNLSNLPAITAATTDTHTGNLLLGIAKTEAAVAIWLDRQSTVHTTNPACADVTTAPASCAEKGVLDRMDDYLTLAGAALKAGFFTPWLPVILLVVGLIVLTLALRGDHAKALRQAGLASVCLMIAALAINAPTTAVHLVDEQFATVVDSVQTNVLADSGIDTTTTSPRDVVINDIIVRQWKAGWFGNPDSTTATNNAAKLRDSLAYTHDQAAALASSPTAGAQKGDKGTCNWTFQNITAKAPCSYDGTKWVCGSVQGQSNSEGCTGPAVITVDKRKQFDQLAAGIKAADPNGYEIFKGKADNRTGKGFSAAAQASCVTLFWIFAGLLKLIALLIVRVGVAFAPLWLPAAFLLPGWLNKVLRYIGAALFWAAVTSIVTIADLVLVIKLYQDNQISDGWRMLLMLFVTVILWSFLRPVKRLTQMIGNNAQAHIGSLPRTLLRGLPTAYGLRKLRDIDRDLQQIEDDRKDAPARKVSVPAQRPITDSRPADKHPGAQVYPRNALAGSSAPAPQSAPARPAPDRWYVPTSADDSGLVVLTRQPAPPIRGGSGEPPIEFYRP
jgi:hypothetical protein